MLFQFGLLHVIRCVGLGGFEKERRWVSEDGTRRRAYLLRRACLGNEELAVSEKSRASGKRNATNPEGKRSHTDLLYPQKH